MHHTSRDDRISLDDLAAFLDRFFAIERYGDDQGGIVRPSTRPIRRIGLALEPWPQLERWVAAERLDALFLHRPWKLEQWPLATEIGVLAYHLAFDERLTLGYNPRLADALGLHTIEVLGEKAGRPLGMLGRVDPQPSAAMQRTIVQIFGGCDEFHATSEPITTVAVVGAMNDALVREAAERGAQWYVTGQFREPARLAVAETGIGVSVVGHRRSEVWGLRALAGVLRERWAGLELRVRG
jgi:putative NIF3 family GTP cyclohydrolase 1 type 2